MKITCSNKTLFSIMNGKNDLKSFLGAIVISSQIIKVFTLVNPIVDVISQALLFACCVPQFRSLKNIRRENLIFSMTFMYVIAATYATSLYSVSHELPIALLKSAFVICTCLSAMTFSKYEIKQTLNYFILINVVYSFLILANKVPYNSSFNYLNYTLPLGCACTILLTRVIYKKITVLNILLACLCVSALTRFSARGPFIFLLIQIIIGSIFNPHKVKGLTTLAITGVVVFYFLFIAPHDHTFNLANRLLNMVDNQSLELGTRDQILSIYWNKLSANWFFGYGVASSRTLLDGAYPHNYLLQIWGELGFIAFASVLMCNIVLFCKYIVNAFRRNISVFQIEIFFALLYYEFQFFKSFDVLSSYPLWIFFIFLLNSFKGEKTVMLPNINY